MNDKQKRMVEWLRKEIIAYDGYHKEEYEYKTFEVKECDFFVEVYSVVGMIGDEHTLASSFARTRRQIFIGKRGGLTLANTAKLNKKTGRFEPSKKKVTGRKVVYWTTI